MSADSYQQNIEHLDKLFDKAKGTRGTERYKAYNDFCTFLLYFPLWKTDEIFRKDLEKLLCRFLTEEIPREVEQVTKWVYDPELLLAVYNDPEYELALYALEDTMSTLRKMMQ